ncbi:MAG TPA: trigger factor [Ktedonobacteraceae bacterium]
MKVSVEKLPTSEAVLEVEVTWDELEKASEKAYRKLVQKVDIQGFRRGKAPRALLERRLGKEYIYQEGLDELISDAYRDALKEHDLTPISQPKLDVPALEIGQPYHFSLTVPIITPVELTDYTSLHFEREEAGVTSEEVDEELESFRKQLTTWEEVQRPIQYGDRIKADLKLISDEQTLSDLKDNVFEITEERHGLFTGMDEHVLGMTAGESKSFTTTVPADYSNEKLAGKEAIYDVVVHLVEEKKLPELDDAFAAKVSDGQYETLEDLSKVLSDNILEKKKRQITNELREKVLDAIIDQSTFAIHPLLIEEEAEEMAHQFGHMLEQQHLNMDQYLKIVRKSREEYLAETRPDAEKRVKRQLVLEEVSQRENITVEPEEIEAILNAYTQMGQELPHSEDQLRSLAFSYRREKALSRLVELTTDPDPDAEVETDSETEASIVNAQSAALAEAEGETETETNIADAQESVPTGEPTTDEEAQSETVKTEEASVATSLASEARRETVE